MNMTTKEEVAEEFDLYEGFAIKAKPVYSYEECVDAVCKAKGEKRSEKMNLEEASVLFSSSMLSMCDPEQPALVKQVADASQGWIGRAMLGEVGRFREFFSRGALNIGQKRRNLVRSKIDKQRMFAMQISFSPPDIGEGEIESIVKALKSGWITTGPATKRLEKEVAAYCGTPCAVALNSATACLEVVLRILGIGAGDEVITSAYTYSASASVIEHVGAKIVLVDTAKDSYFMDAEKLAAAITAKTKAIIPVDIAGVPCDYDGIAQIVEAKKGLFHASNPMQEAIGRVAIVADAAHSFGGIYKGKRIGTQANFTCFSFHAVKNLTTAEGGAVVWKQNPKINDTQVYKEFMLWSLHGQNKDALSKTQIGAWEYDIERLGYKYNMTDVLASIGLAQLERYEGLLEKRHQIVARYEKALDHPDIDILRHSGDNWRSSGHLFLTRMRGFDEKQRNNFIIKMAERGIATNVHYKPLPMHTAYQKYGFAIADFPNAYAQYANEITLPLHTQLTDGMVDYIAENYLDVLNKGVAQ